jgi:hypothetical protein
MVRETVLVDNCVWDILESLRVDLVNERGEDLQFTVSALGLIEIPADSHPNEGAQRVGKYARTQLAALEAEPAVFSTESAGSCPSRPAAVGRKPPDMNGSF